MLFKGRLHDFEIWAILVIFEEGEIVSLIVKFKSTINLYMCVSKRRAGERERVSMCVWFQMSQHQLLHVYQQTLFIRYICLFTKIRKQTLALQGTRISTVSFPFFSYVCQKLHFRYLCVHIFHAKVLRTFSVSVTTIYLFCINNGKYWETRVG